MLDSETLSRFLEHGLYVFPVKKDKTPLTAHGWKDATNHRDTLIEMFASYKDRDPQLAIACEPSGLFVLDVDRKQDKNGFAALATLGEQHGSLPPPTVMAITPNQGLHFYFRGEGRSTVSGLGVGLDVRSAGGYVVCPPSVYTNGRAYTWVPRHSLEDRAITEAPQWLIELNDQPKAPTTPQHTPNREHGRPEGPWANEEGMIPEGHRNDTLFRRACSLRAQGLGDMEIVGAIAMLNAERCQPPLPHDEVCTLVKSACQYAPGTSPDGMTQGDLAPFTDWGNTRRLVGRYSEDIRYTGAWEWLVWDRTRWKADDAGRIHLYAEETVRSIPQEGEQIGDGAADKKRKALQKARREALLQHARQSQHHARLKAMVERAQHQPEVFMAWTAFDRNQWLFNVQNGTLDLRTGTLRAQRRADYLTKLAPVLFDPQATCPHWQAFLQQIFQGNAGLIAYMQRIFGYALTGDVSWQALFLLHGNGANGKSKLLDVLQYLLGEYAAQTDFNTFMVNRWNNTARNDLAQLVNRRVICATEGDIGQHISEALIKQVTGERKVYACFKYCEPFEYEVTYKVFLTTNHLPSITGQDKGMWRRLRVIPFTYEIPEQTRDLYFVEHYLLPELSGILNWALVGCQQWQAVGHEEIPEAVRVATAQYREDMNPFGQFLEECFERDPAAETATDVILDLLKGWATQTHPPLAQMTAKGLSSKMHEHGLTKSSNAHKRGYCGLRPKRLAEHRYTRHGTGLTVEDLCPQLVH